MQSRQTPPGQEVPEWVNREPVTNGFPFAQKMPQPPQSTQHVYQEAVKQQQQQPARVIYQQQPQVQPQQQRPAQTVQYTQNSTVNQHQEQSTTTHRERIIPIQLEQTPTPTKCPTSPGFGPQPYYNMGQQQYSSVQSPGGTVYQNNSPSEWNKAGKPNPENCNEILSFSNYAHNSPQPEPVCRPRIQ